jgi:hypothetical protein
LRVLPRRRQLVCFGSSAGAGSDEEGRTGMNSEGAAT